uniref:YTHD3 n=1 Tax=Steinernema glaseri TaxID=37863 RepID=A0A1I7ZS62_9BILA
MPNFSGLQHGFNPHLTDYSDPSINPYLPHGRLPYLPSYQYYDGSSDGYGSALLGMGRGRRYGVNPRVMPGSSSYGPYQLLPSMQRRSEMGY